MRRASESTVAFYRKGGDLLLAAAAKDAGIDPSTASPDALLSVLAGYFCKPDATLARGTVCVYRQQSRAAIDGLVSGGANVDLANKAMANLFKALEDREGTPAPQRGASNKIDVPEMLELADVFYFLKRRFFSSPDLQDLILSLYILIIPRLGLRPIEVTWARRDGDRLKVATAKRAGHPERDVPLLGWPEEYIFALDLLLALVPKQLDAEEFQKWRNMLASRLARASIHSRKARRLALYCCRHIAFATWREIGMSPEEIRKMAGHANLASQVSYARGKKGFGAKWLFTEVAEAPRTANKSSHFTEIGAENGHRGQQIETGETGPYETANSKDGPGALTNDSVETTLEFDTTFAFEPFPDLPETPPRRARPIDALSDFVRRADEVAAAIERYRKTKGAVTPPTGPPNISKSLS